jgi:hypothetical protein
MGMCLEEYSPSIALKAFQTAAQKNPSNAMAYANAGLMRLQMGDPKGCIEQSNKAIELDPSLIAPIHNMGLAYLMLRDWANGWKRFYDTLGIKHRTRRDYGLPEWEGQEGTVIVYGEQGVGDEIMYASCLKDIMKTNRVIFDCDSRLERLFDRSFDCDVYGTRFKKESPILDDHKPDYQLAIGQLPYFYRQKDIDFDGQPYLKPCPEKSIMWRSLFDVFKGKKIGLAWRGGLPNTGEKKRSLQLSDLEPIISKENTYISLEYKSVDKSDLDKYGIKEYTWATRKGGDIDDLAALIGQLDLVVTCCTTVVYVAGALGIPCYVLVPEWPGYRYHDKGDSLPWYNSVKLIRQKGTWRQTMKQVKQYA